MPDMRSISAWSLAMTDEEFNLALYRLQEKGIISGLRVTKGYDGKIIKVYMSRVQLTEDARRYYNDLRRYNVQRTAGKDESQKKSKIFISHASSDLRYVKAIVELMEDIGVPEKGLFCSSLPGYNIPLGREIYDYIREQLLKYQIKVYFILSSNFYDSVTCLNEAGAVWSLALDDSRIFLPGFDPSQMKGVLTPSKVGIKLDDDIDTIKGRLGEMRDDLISFFGLPKMSETKWERKRDEFIRIIQS
ncbi:MAG: toll/interleukin-1 receptor domain-containing protein [Lachnospiraceae bacterium]|nr:toll/interleukin-1 receptor domain-containing protein [Lachnospiraceae bacterium]